MHILDHPQRLHERSEEDEDRAVTARETAASSRLRLMLMELIGSVIADIKAGRWRECTTVTQLVAGK